MPILNVRTRPAVPGEFDQMPPGIPRPTECVDGFDIGCDHDGCDAATVLPFQGDMPAGWTRRGDDTPAFGCPTHPVA